MYSTLRRRNNSLSILRIAHHSLIRQPILRQWVEELARFVLRIRCRALQHLGHESVESRFELLQRWCRLARDELGGRASDRELDGVAWW